MKKHATPKKTKKSFSTAKTYPKGTLKGKAKPLPIPHPKKTTKDFAAIIKKKHPEIAKKAAAEAERIKKKLKPPPAPKPVRVELHFRKMTGEQAIDILKALAAGKVGGLPVSMNPREAAGCLDDARAGLGAGLTVGYQINKLTGLHPDNLTPELIKIATQESVGPARAWWDTHSSRNGDGRQNVPFNPHIWLGTAAPKYRNPFGDTPPASQNGPAKPLEPGKASSARPPAEPLKISNSTAIPVESTGKRWKVFGLPVTAVLRWCGYDAWSVADCQRLLKVLNIPEVKESTVKAQTNSGRAGDSGSHGPVPKLTTAQEDLLRKAADTPEEKARGNVKKGEAAATPSGQSNRGKPDTLRPKGWPKKSGHHRQENRQTRPRPVEEPEHPPVKKVKKAAAKEPVRKNKKRGKK